MKTPEQKPDCVARQMAEEYAFKFYLNEDSGYAMTMNRDAFLAGYQAAKPQWISVKDRLPEIIKQNDYYADSNCVLIGVVKESDQELPVKPYVTIAHLAQFRSEEPMWTACRCSISGYEVEPNEWKLNQVTHWMPLPKLPENA